MMDWRSERGALSVEFSIIASIFFIGFLVLVVYAGRAGQASNDVRSAAHEAARSASLAGSSGDATAAAQATATANLLESGLTCVDGTVVGVDTTNFVPGGWVTVTISCTTRLSDLAVLNVPGSRTYTFSASEIIDVARSNP